MKYLPTYCRYTSSWHQPVMSQPPPNMPAAPANGEPWIKTELPDPVSACRGNSGGLAGPEDVHKRVREQIEIKIEGEIKVK